MLEELSKYENLGTPGYFFELFNQFRAHNNKWTVRGVNEYFYNRVIDDRLTFDGCLPFLYSLEIIKKKGDGNLLIDSSFFLYSKNNKDLITGLLERLFSKIENDDIFNKIFTSENISYDIINRCVQIKNSAFLFQYSNFKQFLIDFLFLLPYHDYEIKKLKINQKYRNLFDLKILPEIKKKKIGIDSLYKRLEEKRLNGEMAEDFVLNFEKIRLGKEKKVERISDYDVSAGYDIISFESSESFEPDRFIEVKCYTQNPDFYWTRNEIDVAKIKKGKYFIYLVDKNSIDKKKYHPIIIKNPYDNIFKNKRWSKRIEKYFINKVD